MHKLWVFVFLLFLWGGDLDQTPISANADAYKDFHIQSIRKGPNTRSVAHVQSVYYLEKPNVYSFNPHRLRDLLREGDIIFFRVDPKLCDFFYAVQGQDGEEIDYLILQGQRLLNTEFPNTSNHIHVGLYLGNGQILESIPRTEKGIHVSTIYDADFILAKDEAYSYSIYRLSDAKARKKIMKIAHKLKNYVETLHPQSVVYSGKDALKALLRVSTDDRQGVVFPHTSARYEPLYLRHVFCSYLVSWIINQSFTEGLLFERPEHTTPSSIVAFLDSHPNLFTKVGEILPPVN